MYVLWLMMDKDTQEAEFTFLAFTFLTTSTDFSK